MPLWETISADIAAATGRRAGLRRKESVGGGCINQALRVEYGDCSYLVKLSDADGLEMFAAEALGLQELQQCGSLRIPEPVCWGSQGQSSYIVMEYLDLGGGGDAVALAAGLAELHRITRPEFGWVRDNTIGSTLQINTPSDNWIDFWRDKRLRFQLDLAARNGAGGRLQAGGERLLADFPQLFSDYTPAASLLHGDLWGGNQAYTRSGEPAIFDPAVYYGDREADIAMTELFGGFGRDFHAAYREYYPLDAGYTVRKRFYNLYHVLNHFNMFGGGYLSQAQGMLDSLLGELSG
ncbi:MAG TPA: fructosamine kinase family protein [Gammaproteobacteria bacterium]|nr:fructosamine kinase family protein [Gammaproteobacteria bacterium]